MSNSDDSKGGGGAGVGGGLLMALAIGAKACLVSDCGAALRVAAREAEHELPAAGRVVTHAAPELEGPGKDAFKVVVRDGTETGGERSGARAGHWTHFVPHAVLERDRVFAKEIHSPRLVAVLPASDSEFREMFGRAPRGGEERDLGVLRGQITSDSRASLARHTTTRDFLAGLSSQDDSNLVIVLAHSGDGGVHISLADGTLVGVGDIHGECLRAAKVCLVLSCNGPDFGIRGEVAFSDAYEMWRRTIETNGATTPTVGSFVDRMKEARAAMQRDTLRVRVTLTSAGIGTTYIVVSDS